MYGSGISVEIFNGVFSGILFSVGYFRVIRVFRAFRVFRVFRYLLFLLEVMSQMNCGYHLSSPRAKRASPKAVTVSQCPHSEVGQDFLLRRRVTLTEIAVTRKEKFKNGSEGAKLKLSPRATNGPLTKSGVV